MQWSDMFDYFLPELPGVGQDIAKTVIRRAAIEFCEETFVWTYELTPINVVAGTATYSMVAPLADSDIAVILNAWYDGKSIHPVSPENLAQFPVYWPDVEGKPSHFTQETQDTVRLYPKPVDTVSDALRIRVGLRPSLASQGILDWLANKYIQEFAMGAKSILKAMNGKPWTDPEGAMMCRAQFEGAKTRAAIDATRGFTRGPLRMRLRGS